MICTRLQGGLGNQLFQYAAGRALALRHQVDLLIDVQLLQRKNPKITPRRYELDRFRHTGRVCHPGDVRVNWRNQFLPRRFQTNDGWRLYREPGIREECSFFSLPDNTVIEGFWQSPFYFQHIAQVLAAELTLISPMSQSGHRWLDEIQGCSTVSVGVHIRRGDYVTLPSAAHFHGVLPMSYYECAFGHMRKHLHRPTFFVFSDEPAWCERQPIFLSEDTVVIGPDHTREPCEDLILMSRCQHHVIANSSFSWWSAWLADQSPRLFNRQVFAPRQWFAQDRGPEVYPRFPSHWVQGPS